MTPIPEPWRCGGCGRWTRWGHPGCGVALLAALVAANTAAVTLLITAAAHT